MQSVTQLQLEASETCCCSLDENRNVFVGNIWTFKFLVSNSYCTLITVPVSNKAVTLFIAHLLKLLTHENSRASRLPGLTPLHSNPPKHTQSWTL